MLLAVLLLAVLPWTMGRSGRSPARPRRHRPRRRPADAGEVASDPAVLLDLVDVALAAGASIPDAVRSLGVALPVGGTARALAGAGLALRLGASWSEAWEGCPLVLAPLADALEPAWLDGADPGPLVRRAAVGVRARRQRVAREAAERLGAKLVLPLGLCYLPAFVLLSLIPVLVSGGASLLGG